MLMNDGWLSDQQNKKVREEFNKRLLFSGWGGGDRGCSTVFPVHHQDEMNQIQSSERPKITTFRTYGNRDASVSFV